MEDNLRVPQNVIIEDRKKFVLSGVKDVISFDEETVMLMTSLGRLVIKGDSLQIQNFNNETGDISGIGRVHAIAWTTDEERGGFFSRIFK